MMKKNYSPSYRTYKPTYLEKKWKKMDRHTGGKWLILDPKHNKGNRSQSLKHHMGA